MGSSFGKHRQDIEAAARVGLSIGVPLFLMYGLGHLDLVIFTGFGALTSLYGHREIGLRRIETQIAAGLALAATVALGTAFSAAHGPAWLLGCLLVLTVVGAGTLGASMGWLPRGEMFFVLVLLVTASVPVPWSKVPTGAALALSSASFSVLMSVIWHFALYKGKGDSGAVAPHSRAAEGFAVLDRRQHAIAIAACAIGVLATWLVALGFGVGHPYWGPMTVASLMPGLASPDVYRRMVHLILGTSGGVAAAAIIYSFQPSHLALIVIILVCQTAAEFFIARIYGVALLFVAPLAVGLSNLYTGLPWPAVLEDRITEVALGAIIAFLVIVAARHVLSASQSSKA